MPLPSLTARVCQPIFATGRGPIARSVRQSAMQLLLDGIAVGVAGARIEAAPGILAAYFADQGARPVATLRGLNGMRLATVPAALVPLLNGFVWTFVFPAAFKAWLQTNQMAGDWIGEERTTEIIKTNFDTLKSYRNLLKN